MTGYADQARSSGAAIVPLFAGAERNQQSHRLAPALVIDPSPDLDLMREEIFGPVLAVIPYDDVKDAIAFINAQPRALAMYWFDNDAKRVEVALKNNACWGVCVNETLLHGAQEDLPFGGVVSLRHGPLSQPLGLFTFSKLTSWVPSSRFNATKLFLPPVQSYVGKALGLNEAVLLKSACVGRPG